MQRFLIGAISVLLPSVAFGATEVGAYYYPWYGPYPGGHTWTQTLREHLLPQEQPAEGFYSSRDQATIDSQIAQSHRGNIGFWAMSWWGPNSAEDQTIRNSIFTDPRAGELKYAVNYESTGRLGDPNNPSFGNLTPDFQFLAQNYFTNPNYLRINNRPVVFLYVTRAYFNTPAARTAVANLRQTMESQFHFNPYLVGDDVFPGDNDTQRAALWDAITDFDVYGSALQGNGSTRAAVNVLANQYAAARQTAHSLRIGFIPTASPGFNDTAVRSGHHPAPRYLTDVPNSPEGSLFSSILSTAALPNLDPAADNILMINSFNEWHEDTQIEATLPAFPTSNDDSGTRAYTSGYTYTGYRDLYLDELRNATVPEPAVTTLVVMIPMIVPRRARRAA
jgi:glycoprotein endo-alpha-1,2-mannosidase